MKIDKMMSDEMRSLDVRCTPSSSLLLHALHLRMQRQYKAHIFTYVHTCLYIYHRFI